MSEKNPHITPETLKAYVNGTLSKAERHVVEKAASRDIAVRDALAGYENLQTQNTDLSAVNNRLKNRLNERLEKPERKPIFVWWKYGLAASVLFGLLMGSYLIFDKLGTENLAMESSPAETVEQKNPPLLNETQTQEAEITDNSSDKPIATKPPQVYDTQRNSEHRIFSKNESDVFEDQQVLEDPVVVMDTRPPDKKQDSPPSAAARQERSQTLDAPLPTEFSGKIVGTKGEPLPGVAVIAKNEQTKTDIQGNFKLKSVSPNEALQLSYSGFPQQEIKVNESESTIILSENSAVFSDKSGAIKPLPNQSAIPKIGWKFYEQELTIKSDRRGKVVLLLTISPVGKVTKKELKKGMGEPYDSQALKLPILDSHWNPKRKNGQTIESKAEVTVRFRK